mmetsp:Transcript_13786/g.51426  ORF Transcript_13786/g.51426 Transcript_13786/m.51426 type:complete len:309 (+) Transcript_13786:1630-2556(+)
MNFLIAAGISGCGVRGRRPPIRVAVGIRRRISSIYHVAIHGVLIRRSAPAGVSPRDFLALVQLIAGGLGYHVDAEPGTSPAFTIFLVGIDAPRALLPGGKARFLFHRFRNLQLCAHFALAFGFAFSDALALAFAFALLVAGVLKVHGFVRVLLMPVLRLRLSLLLAFVFLHLLLVLFLLSLLPNLVVGLIPRLVGFFVAATSIFAFDHLPFLSFLNCILEGLVHAAFRVGESASALPSRRLLRRLGRCRLPSSVLSEPSPTGASARRRTLIRASLIVGFVTARDLLLSSSAGTLLAVRAGRRIPRHLF